jgi:hypothetical protein
VIETILTLFHELSYLPTIFLCGKVSMAPALDEDDDPQITIDLSSLTDSGTQKEKTNKVVFSH